MPLHRRFLKKQLSLEKISLLGKLTRARLLHGEDGVGNGVLRDVPRLVLVPVPLDVRPVLHGHEAAVAGPAQQVADELVVALAAADLEHRLAPEHRDDVAQRGAVTLGRVLVLGQYGEDEGGLLVEERAQVAAPAARLVLAGRLPGRQGRRLGLAEEGSGARVLGGLTGGGSGSPAGLGQGRRGGGFGAFSRLASLLVAVGWRQRGR